SGLAEPRNDALFPPHGSLFGSGQRAGCGLAIGRNGVCVLEHGAAYFAPLLVHAVPLTDWTHIAVVYRQAQPSLYINGELACVGLKSNYTVHPGTAAGGGGRPFVGELGAIETISRALDADGVVALMQSMDRPGTRPPGTALELERGAGGALSVQVRQPGEYVLVCADGERRIRVDAVPPPLLLAGPWDVQFDPHWGGPAQITFNELCDWTQRPEEGVRHYSGTATYRRTFALPDDYAGRRLWLELGRVRDLAVVRVNSQPLGTLWCAPYRVEITRAVRAGDNQLDVDVINAWNNRLVGDLTLPVDQRRTSLALPVLSATTPLMPAGLLGPVQIEAAVEVVVE
ncbi:MAG: LamG domain-containing protein, partial [Pirellulaceae bacterium]|nr:LamG domain-containing protein [Pirellulaceae bacterium]